MDIGFENHFAERFMEVTFGPNSTVDSPSRIVELQRRWSENVLMWHTPYCCLVNLDHLIISDALVPDWNHMLRMFHGFHLEKIVGVLPLDLFTPDNRARLVELGFDEIVSTREEAQAVLGVRDRSQVDADDGSVRRRIRTINHFEQRIMEILFARPTTLRTEDDVLEIRARIEYNIHQWHTDYCVVFNCDNLIIDPEAVAEFEKMQRFFRSFFCKSFFGYSENTNESYPFRTFRTRETALENCAQILGAFSPSSNSEKHPAHALAPHL